MLGASKAWLEDRAGAGKALRSFMDEAVPKSTGWRNTLGSVAGALILLQLVTGILLMLFYVPHPDAAYESLEYIGDVLRGGGLVMSLHYWGASFIVVAIFVHMMRVFFSGAYKKPRELTWLVGVGLFGIIMGFAFTGQLLPWNQSGYWAAKVGIEIASSAPIVGDIIKQLLTGGETVGALTLTRFYTVHVILLPLALGLLVPLHLYLLRRHGPMRPADDASTDTVPFYPWQLARDLVMISIVFAGLIAVAFVFSGPRSGPIDLADTSYIPRPEWFFLSHFEILRFTPGPLKIVATFVLPNVLLVLLLVLPWLDRANATALKKRWLVLSAGTVVIAGIVGLTVYGIARESGAESTTPSGDGAYDKVLAGREHYEEGMCANCHRIDGEGERVGPDLSGVGLRLKEEYMRQWIINPARFVPRTMMPPAMIDRPGLNELVAYLQSLHHMPEE